MSLNRWAKKRDANEGDIIEYLEKRGFSVCQMDQPLDLLVGRNKKNYLVEVKTLKGKLTEPQEKFIKKWTGQFIVINSVGQARTFADGVIFGAGLD